MKNRQAKPKTLAKDKRKPSAPPPKPQGYSYERTTMGNPAYSERIPRMRKVPGTGKARWDRTIGQYVVGYVKSDMQREFEMGELVW